MSSPSPSIAFHNLSFNWPDGTRVFENLYESLHKCNYGLVGNNGSGKTTLFDLIAGNLRPTSGSVSVTGKLALIRQVTAYPEGISVADQIGVTSTMILMQKAEKGLATIEELAEIDWQLESKMEALFERVGLSGLSLSDRSSKLSGGQQTRLAFASIQYLQPDMLLLDEPTNNLDQSGRAFVADFLRSFPGLAVTISHDRALLNSLETTLELTRLGLKVYGGNWEFYKSQKAGELSRAEHVLRSAKNTLLQSARHAQKVKERKDRKDAAGRRKNKSGANAKILMNAQAERAENSSGLTRNDTAKRQSAISKRVENAASKVDRLIPLKIDLPTSGLPSSREILRLSDVSIGYDNGPVLARGISFSMVGPERLLVAGENGTGKSTLLRTIASQIPLRSGEMKVTQRLSYLDRVLSALPAI